MSRGLEEMLHPNNRGVALMGICTEKQQEMLSASGSHRPHQEDATTPTPSVPSRPHPGTGARARVPRVTARLHLISEGWPGAARRTWCSCLQAAAMSRFCLLLTEPLHGSPNSSGPQFPHL